LMMSSSTTSSGSCWRHWLPHIHRLAQEMIDLQMSDLYL
jgi:hypothetical protein